MFPFSNLYSRYYLLKFIPLFHVLYFYFKPTKYIHIFLWILKFYFKMTNNHIEKLWRPEMRHLIPHSSNTSAILTILTHYCKPLICQLCHNLNSWQTVTVLYFKNDIFQNNRPIQCYKTYWNDFDQTTGSNAALSF